MMKTDAIPAWVVWIAAKLYLCYLIVFYVHNPAELDFMWMVIMAYLYGIHARNLEEKEKQ